MNIKDILNESATDLVAHCYTDASDELDSMYNPEATQFAELNREHYKEYFEEFYANGTPPVFEKEDNHFDPNATEWHHKPAEGEIQSAGYRGQQRALDKAGVPHDKNVQRYDPDTFATRDAINQRINTA